MLSEQRDVIRDIIAVLRKHVEVDDININHSFSSLGITSLRAVQLVNELNATLGVRLKAHDLFLYPTPLALSNYLTNKSTKLEVSEAIFSSENRQNKNEAIAFLRWTVNIRALMIVNPYGITVFQAKNVFHFLIKSRRKKKIIRSVLYMPEAY